MDQQGRTHEQRGRASTFGVTLALLAAATLAGCAAAPEVRPTYEALERGFRWQCEGSPDPGICVHHKFLALQERRARQLTLNECAVSYGWVARARQGEQCRNAPEPQKIECRTLFGTMTCTIADE
jgi:hypothetical protein